MGRRETSGCYCTQPVFDEAFEFVDETGFECQGCGSNVFYVAAVA